MKFLGKLLSRLRKNPNKKQEKETVMAGQFGVEESKEVAETLAKGLNVASKMVHGDFFAGLGLIGVLNGIKGIDFELFKKEVGELDQAERDAVQAAFVNNLDLVNKDVQTKIVAGTNALQDAVDLVTKALGLWKEAELLVNQLKSILAGDQPVQVKA